MENSPLAPFNLEEIKEAIFNLYDECLGTSTPFHRKLDLFVIPEPLALRIQETTGVVVSGHWACIDNYGIIHTLEQHGNPFSESRRGQIAVEKADFVIFLDVFLNPDEIQLSGKTRHTNLPLLQFTKVLEDKLFVIKEVRTITSTKKQKVSRLIFHTMYKKKVGV